MKSLRILLYIAGTAVAALSLIVSAQMSLVDAGAPPSSLSLSPPGQSYLGLNPPRTRVALPCTGIAFFCDDRDRAVQLAPGARADNFWGLEMGLLDFGNVARPGGVARAQGLNLSLVRKAPLGHSLHAFGRVGTTWGRTESSGLAGNFMAGPERGFGFSFGAGLSYDITPRLSATLEWESTDFRFLGGGREPVRSTNLGLQFRY